MKQKVLLKIHSEQQYTGEEADVSELTTIGSMEWGSNEIRLSYEETELTGLQGTTTSFLLQKDQITLKREGALRSEMIFAIDREHRSLYDMGMGALLITVRTMTLIQAISPEGGFVDVAYDLLIEDSNMGQVRYHMEVTPLES
ncbi:MAG: DUF1934 domain-containing protein [Oscillospiraceae bacterium]|nr:DUF1934 domain-containing protein [Oscillospiraceae bacterium]